MTSAFVLLITLFSWAYLWHTVASQSACDIEEVNRCYGISTAEEGIAILSDESRWDAFCGMVENPNNTCLEALSDHQKCVEFTRVQYPHLCTLPFEDVSTSFQCYFDLQEDNELISTECRATQPPFEPTDSTFDACEYYTAELRCYNDSLSRRCPDNVEPVLDHFTKFFFYVSGRDLSGCQQFQAALCGDQFQSCVGGPGPLDFLPILNESATIPEREALFNTFCGNVRTLVTCVETVSVGPACAALLSSRGTEISRFTEVYRAFLLDMTCSRSFSELLDVQTCLNSASENINSVSSPACTAHEAFDEDVISLTNSMLSVHGDALCGFINGLLGCLDDSIDLYCHRTQEFSKCYARGALTFLGVLFLNAECPLFDEMSGDMCNFPSGASAVHFYWVTTVILALMTFVVVK